MKNFIASTLLFTAFTSTTSFAKVPPLHYDVALSQELSESIVNELKKNNVTSDFSGMDYDVWTFAKGECESIYFENMAIGGGAGIQRDSCTLAVKDGSEAVLSKTASIALMDELKDLGFEAVSTAWLNREVYSLENVKCSFSSIEIVSAGGGGFERIENFSCTVQK